MVGARSYRFRELLGEGAFGAVYRAEVVGAGLEREVAIKLLHTERAANAGIVRRLRDEARMLSIVRHRAIVRVDDLVELDGAWSIVMEYVEGCDIATLLAQGPLPPQVAAALVEETANALHAAWQQSGPDGVPLRLIHRDIKPGNLRVTAQGELKLLDFGVARAEFASREAGTTRGSFGTLAYMAAERFEGHDSHASDVYALGVTLFEMLVCAAPGPTAGDPDRQPPGVRLVEQWAEIHDISPRLHALVARMLAYEPGDRPTARECAAALGEIRAELGGERVEDWAARVVPPIITAARAHRGEGPRVGSIFKAGATPPQDAPPPRRVLPWVAGGLAGLGLALAGALVVASGLWFTMYRAAPHAAPVPAPQLEQTPAPTEPAPVPVPVELAPPPPSVEPAPAPAVEPAPASAAAPAPAPAVEPAPAPAPSTGELRLAGDPVAAVVTGPGGRVRPGSVPPGVYTAEVTFAGGDTVIVRDIVVSAGRTTRLTCSLDFKNCRSKVE